MTLVLNCASTCANETVGLAGQNGDNLMLTAAMVVWWVDVPTVGVSPVGGVGSSERVSMWTSA